MQVELLKIPDCPGADIAYDRLREVLDGLGVGEAIRTIEIATEERARQLRFPGSPTLRIDGRDVEPSAERIGQYALACRLYESRGTVDNAPSTLTIRRSVKAALERTFAAPDSCI
jgi:hypothetical protein